MKTTFTISMLLLLIGLVCIAQKHEPKVDPRVKKLADQMFINQLKIGYLAYRDSSEMRKEALIKIYSSPYWSNLEKDY